MKRAMIGMAAALLLAACGGGNSDDEPTATTQVAESTTAPADGDLDEVEGDLNGCGVPDRDLNPDGSCPS